MPGMDVCGHHDNNNRYHVDLGSGPEMGYVNGGNVVLNRAANHPNLATVEARRNTFRDWPQAMPQRPQAMAEAGFFYTGRGDQVQCYHCDGGLKNWSGEDSPWEEHARWFGQCSYLNLMKGADYVDDVRRKYERGESASDVEVSLGSATSTASIPTSEGSDELERLRSERRCVLCLDADRQTVFVPCGHMVACAKCAAVLTAVSTNGCPVCRSKIHAFVRTFRS